MNITQRNNDLAAQIAEHYGIDHQISIAQEECAELIQALSKLRRVCEEAPDSPGKSIRYTEARGKVAEEMADVENLLIQLTHLLHNEATVDFWLQAKQSRTLDRMEKEDL